jgi:hypothetical protein
MSRAEAAEVSFLRERFMRAVRAKAAERFEAQRREQLARRAWLESISVAWDDRKHKNFGTFLRSRAGRTFRRRAFIVIAK